MFSNHISLISIVYLFIVTGFVQLVYTDTFLQYFRTSHDSTITSGDHDVKLSNTKKCNKFSCFNSFACELNEPKQLIYYVYPPVTFRNETSHIVYSSKTMMTKEYWQLLETFLNSPRRTLDPAKACIFVPSIDLTYLRTVDKSIVSALFNSLPHWKFVDGQPGTNHLVIALDPNVDLDDILNSVGRAIMISNRHDTWTYRPEFDLSIPVVIDSQLDLGLHEPVQKWSLISNQFESVSSRQKVSIESLKVIMQNKFLVLRHKCPIEVSQQVPYEQHENLLACYEVADDNATLIDVDKATATCRCSSDNGGVGLVFPAVLSLSSYCLILNTGWQQRPSDSIHYLLAESLKHGCIPIVSSDYILPYGQGGLIDWSRISIPLTNSDMMTNIREVIASITPEKREKMSSEGKRVWSEHFKTEAQVAGSIMRHFDSLVYPSVLLDHSSDL